MFSRMWPETGQMPNALLTYSARFGRLSSLKDVFHVGTTHQIASYFLARPPLQSLAAKKKTVFPANFGR